MVPHVRRASIFLGVALVLPSAQVECSRARRRHYPTPATYTNSGGKPPLVSPQDGMIREESSIPGVSIWTSKTAAFSRTPTPPFHTSTYDHGDDEVAGFSGDCQVSLMDCGVIFHTGCASKRMRRHVSCAVLREPSRCRCHSRSGWFGHVGGCEQHTNKMCEKGVED